MTPNAFINKTKQPTNTELSAALGPARETWDQLLAELERNFGADVREWNSYSPKAGWSLRVKCKKRTIVWLAPCPGLFRAAFIFGDKAVMAAQNSGLPKRILNMIAEAPKYPEGTGLRLEVKSSKDMSVLKKLTAIKVAN